MSLYSSLVSEVKKGCDKYIVDIVSEGKRIRVQCGQLELCPSCQSKLDILAKFKDMAEKEIDEKVKSRADYLMKDSKVLWTIMASTELQTFGDELKQKLLGAEA